MTNAVDWDVKHKTKPNKQTGKFYWDWLISAKIFVMLVRFRELLRLYQEYEDTVHASSGLVVSWLINERTYLDRILTNQLFYIIVNCMNFLFKIYWAKVITQHVKGQNVLPWPIAVGQFMLEKMLN